MLGTTSANNENSSTKQRRRQSALKQDAIKEAAESSDEECNKRENEDEANSSLDSIEIDLSQKLTPPSKQYQSAMVSKIFAYGRFTPLVTHSSQLGVCLGSRGDRHHSV